MSNFRPVQVNPSRYSEVDFEKLAGSHYTPRTLADFVANQIVTSTLCTTGNVNAIDPAIGDGELVLALLRALKTKGIEHIKISGFDTNPDALALAEERIKTSFPDVELNLFCESFLDFVVHNYHGSSVTQPTKKIDRFDILIANPPYVRTQVLGASQAQKIAQQFGLSGRVDLYHAFMLAAADVLKPGGKTGIIVSNRFMTTRAGAGVRKDILSRFDVQHIWDLGDTKMFAAAVLPAVLLLSKKDKNTALTPSLFTSVYSSKTEGQPFVCKNIVEGLGLTGLIANENNERFMVHQGLLDQGQDASQVWRLKNDTSEEWLAQIQANTWGKFGDVGKIRVGVKTTADKVFIRSDWQKMPSHEIPELLKPLTTHHIARRFRARDINHGKQILYPHTVTNGRRSVVPLSQYPRAAHYLEQHRATLESRTYVTESGRKWYEIWVPQDPAAWTATKLVFRDISARPEFWIDLEGSVVNGDCYWLVASPGQEDLLWLALAVSNSTFIEAYYDRCFNNKLYAGRRRFCTQYVEKFPLPDPSKATSLKLIELSKAIYNQVSSPHAETIERELDALVWQAFGVSTEEGSR